jgi:hypothetical protein
MEVPTRLGVPTAELPLVCCRDSRVRNSGRWAFALFLHAPTVAMVLAIECDTRCADRVRTRTTPSRARERYRRAVPEEPTIAFGLLLKFAATKKDGRSSPLPGGHDISVRFTHRPNWGLPNMAPPDQIGAPVLGFSRSNIQPGDEVRAVIVPLYPEMVGEWDAVTVGDELYEGTRVYARARVLWRRGTSWPLPKQDEDRFRTWLAGPDEAPEPVE